MKRKSLVALLGTVLITSSALVGCQKDTNKDTTTADKNNVVNVYSDRHYDTDKQIFKDFTEKTGIKVNVVEGKSDELIERMAREGKDTKADLLITADAGRLHRAKEQGLLQPTTSDVLAQNIPQNLKDKDNQWYGLTKRGRVIVYSKDRVNPTQLSTYEALTESKWKGKVLVRSSSSVYNQSLLASFIEINGEEKAEQWAKGIVNNLAREPKGNDRDQAKAIVSGVGDVAIMNTYYIGKMLNSSDPEEVKVAKQVGVFFPNNETTGTHINVSGIGVTKNSKNKDNAIKLMEYLSSEEVQRQFADSNFEYPVNPKVEASELLKSWGTFKEQDINLSKLGENNKKAVQIFNKVGWK